MNLMPTARSCTARIVRPDLAEPAEHRRDLRAVATRRWTNRMTSCAVDASRLFAITTLHFLLAHFLKLSVHRT